MSTEDIQQDDFMKFISSQQESFSSSYVKDFNTNFAAPKSNYTLTPTNTSLQIQRSLDGIVSPNEQNLFKWAKEFLESAMLCQWNPETQLAVLRTTISSNLHTAIDFSNGPIAAIKSVFRLKYNQLEASQFSSALENLKQDSFYTISEYLTAIFEITDRFCLCNEFSFAFSIQKKQEAFSKGLSNETRFEMAKLNLMTSDEIFSAIHKAETIVRTTTQTQLPSYRNFKDRQNFNGTRNRQPNNYTRSSNSKYCSYHKTYGHTNNECRALKQETNSGSVNAIQETLPVLKDLTTKIQIDDKFYNALIDTGANANLIRKSIIKEHGIKTNGLSQVFATTVDKRVIPLLEEADLRFRIPEFNDKHYEIKARVVELLSFDLILATTFLQENRACIDFNDNTLRLDGRMLPLIRSKELNPDDTIFSKTKVCSFTDDALNSFESFINEKKINTPALGNIKTAEHRIALTSYEPLMCKPIPVPISKIADTEAELKRLEELGVIKRSNSSFTSAAFPLYKRNGSVRLVVDYRKLNQRTIPLNFPLPKIGDYLAQLNGAKIFSQIDLNQGFYQIPVAAEDQHLTSFVILNKQYEFTRMPFGLSNAPRTFQSTMTDMLGSLNFVKIYLDDILIHSSSVEEHEEHIKTVLQILEENMVSINWEKTSLMKDLVKYLGHILSSQGVQPDTTRINSLTFKEPRTKREIMRTLGTLQWFRPFLRNAAEKLRFLTEKLRKGNKKRWSEQDTKSLESVVAEIKEQTLLNYPDWNSKMEIETDASDYAIGAVLKQSNKLLGFYSHILSGSECRYSTPEKEFYALLRALEHFRTLVFGQTIIVSTDSRNALGTSKLTKRIERWKLSIQDMDVHLKFVPGVRNQIADHLSRICSISIDDELHRLFKKVQLWQQTFHKKEDITRKETAFGPFLVEKGRERIIVPDQNAKEFVFDIHHLLSHPGKTSLTLSIRRFFSVLCLEKTTSEISSNCSTCLRNKKRKRQLFKLQVSFSRTRH